ncbi:UreD urease accessory protein-domain-containing protein [Mycena rebaudengoi]|nr:UreD urease accessory protein-domain-containing protein [Mycena rebaudengoi]
MTAGRGRIALALHGAEAVFSELSSTYPLKLLSPRIVCDGVAVAYMITYGGGLGSTKVFKLRPGQRAASAQPHGAPQVTSQRVDVRVCAGAGLFLLPSPVTCFEGAAYNQVQTFRLALGASLAAVDWVTSGRKTRGEEWVFSRYYSVNEVVVDGRRVGKDVMLLEREGLAEKLAPYSCYATVLLYGPLVAEVVKGLREEYARISVTLLWSLSALGGDAGAVVRVAGSESELVRRWLGNALGALQGIVGVDVYRRAF